jgi:hypothetical protein
VNGILSLWRFPIDQVAVCEAMELSACQPSCSIGVDIDFSAMTIYNYRAYVDNFGNPNDALTNMFFDMNAAIAPGGVGGAAFIRQQGFGVQASSLAVPDQCNIVGTGGGGDAPGAAGTPFYHFSIDFSLDSTFFSCNSTGSYTTGGKYFRSLAFQGTKLGSKTDTCIYAATANVRAYSCTFKDIPTALKMQGSGCALEQCTISYLSGKDSAKAIVIGGSQCGVFGPSAISQQPGGPQNCTGISIEGADHAVLANLHVSDWNIGVDFSQYRGSEYVGAQNVEIRNCEIMSVASALNIQLAMTTSAVLSGVKVTSCHLAKSNNSSATDPVVLIDINFNLSNNQLYDIVLVDCTVFNMGLNGSAQYGLQITGGTNLKVLGGTYSNNGSGNGAGIAITGPCGDLQIVGANLQPSYPWAGTTKHGGLNSQTFALLVTGGPTGTVLVLDCDMSGYGTGVSPVSVSGTPPNELLIYSCVGYNDQGFQISMVAPTAATYAAQASSLGTHSIDYFGPSMIVYSSPSPVTLHAFGQTITQSFGIVFLPSPYDSIYFSGGPPSNFYWVGK